MSLNRRQLAKGLLAGVAASKLPALAQTQHPPKPSPEAVTLNWKPVHPGVWKATIGSPEAFTPVSSRLLPSAKQLDSMITISKPPLGNALGEVTQRGCLLRLPLGPGEMLYGFGLQLLSFAQRGKKKTMRVNADPRFDTGDSHAPVPFYVSTAGYGVLVDTARHADFYCGNAHPKPTHAEKEHSAAVNTPEETYDQAQKEASEVTVEVPQAKGVDVYLFGGPTMLEAVQRYNLFAGGGVLPPEWGLGFWYRAEGHGTQQSITALAQELREHKIPCDVLGLEPGWQSHAYSCTFTWDKTRFPEPKKFFSEITALNYKVNLWEHAFTNPAAPFFEELLPYAGDYGVWGGLVPDFAGEEARRIFGDYHGKELIDLGVSGFKLDECDSSDYTGGWSFPDLSRFPSGVDGEQMHSVFGLRYQHAIWRQFKDRMQSTYGLVRSSGALASPYPFVLYSDLYDHRQFIRGLVNSGFSGLLWCPEVRDSKSEEDLIRRLQSVVFSPLAMVNAWYIKNPPWKQIDRKKNNADQLAPNWQALEARCREVLGWRMQLVPYLLSAFERYEQEGIPPFRALILDYPDDKNLLKIDDEYLIGDRMLVAPLFAGEAERKITLPKGAAWRDFWTGMLYQGGSVFSIPARAEKIPVFVKDGSVIPWANVGSSTASPEAKQLSVRIYGDGSLPWHRKALQLEWSNSERKGKVQSTGANPYILQSWEQIG